MTLSLEIPKLELNLDQFKNIDTTSLDNASKVIALGNQISGLEKNQEDIISSQWNRWGTLAKEIGGAAMAGIGSWLKWKELDIQKDKIENDFAVQKLVVALQETVAEKEANYKIEALENTKDLAEINSNTEVAKKRLDNADRKDERHSRTLKELFSSRKTPHYGYANG